MSGAPNILFVSDQLPGAEKHGGAQWSRQLIGAMRYAGAIVTVVGHGPATCEGEISAGPAPRALPAFARGLLLRRSLSAERWRSRAYRRLLAAMLATKRWDAVVINGLKMAWARSLSGSRPAIGVMHQVESRLYRHLAAQSPWPARQIYAREARLMAHSERRLDGLAALWCISAPDCDYFAEEYGDRAVEIPPVAQALPATFPQPTYDLGLLGNWLWQPNAIALRKFLNDVVPQLPANWRIAVAGNMHPDADDLTRVERLGAVADAAAFLRNCTRIAVPSESVTGCNLKLIDAVASGRAVVASVGAGGLVGDCPSHVMFAANAPDFAAKLQLCQAGDRGEIEAWASVRNDAAQARIMASLQEVLGARP